MLTDFQNPFSAKLTVNFG